MSWLLVYIEKAAWFEGLISKFMTSQPDYKTTTTHILPNTTIKFGQSKEYNKRNNFFLKSCTKWGRQTSSKPLLEKSLRSFSTTVCVWFFKKSVFHVTFYYCLVAFTSWDIGQYVYWNCLLTRLWRQKFKN